MSRAGAENTLLFSATDRHHLREKGGGVRSIRLTDGDVENCGNLGAVLDGALAEAAMVGRDALVGKHGADLLRPNAAYTGRHIVVSRCMWQCQPYQYQ